MLEPPEFPDIFRYNILPVCWSIMDLESNLQFLYHFPQKEYTKGFSEIFNWFSAKFSIEFILSTW